MLLRYPAGSNAGSGAGGSDLLSGKGARLGDRADLVLPLFRLPRTGDFSIETLDLRYPFDSTEAVSLIRLPCLEFLREKRPMVDEKWGECGRIRGSDVAALVATASRG